MKYRRLIAAMLLPLTLALITGCARTYGVPPDDLRPTKANSETEAVRGVVTVSGEKVRFDDPVVPVADTLHATVQGEPYRIALDQVDQVVVKRGLTSSEGYVLAIVLTTVVLTVGGIAMYRSGGD